MKNINPIIIIEFNNHERTVKFIEDCLLNIISDKKLVFVIVDNGYDINKYYNFKENIIIKYKNDYVLKIDELDKKENQRIMQCNILKFKNEKKEFDVICIKSKENYGFAIGNNIGAQIVEKIYDFDYIVFSNNDLIFDNKFNLNNIIDIMRKDKHIALVGPKVMGLDNIPQSPCIEKEIWQRWNVNSIFWPLNRIVKLKILNSSDDIMLVNESKFVFRIIGAFMVFDYKKFKEINMFDEGTFLYGEELIIGEKLKQKGYKTLYDNNNYIIHEQGTSTQKTFSCIETLKMKFNSEIYYYEKIRKNNKFTIYLSKVLFNFYILKLTVIKSTISKKYI